MTHSTVPFQVKICGVTRLEDAYAVQGAGGDAIGLNFFSKGKRFIHPDAAYDLVNEFRGQTTREQYKACAYRVPKVFGVFVNASVSEILEVHQLITLDGIQLHGDETLEFVKELKRNLPGTALTLVRAIHVPEKSDSPGDIETEVSKLASRIDDWAAHGIDVALLDAAAPGEYGGTGKSIDWHSVHQLHPSVPIPLILAGGLTPQNVQQAIRISGVSAVDVASGVESSPGIKDRDATAQFVHNSVVAIAETRSSG